MNETLKFFLMVLISTVLGLSVLSFYLLNRSLSEAVKPPPDHPFLSRAFPAPVAYRGIAEGATANSLEALAPAAAISPELILWVDVVGAADSQDLQLAPAEKGSSKSVSLKETLARFPLNRFILNFQGNRPGLKEAILAAIDESKAGDRVLIQSPEDALLRELREKRPLWVFGTSQAQSTLMKMLASIGFEPMAPKRGDAFVLEWLSRSAQNQGVSDRVIREAHRRRQKIFVGPVDNPELAAQLRSRGVDGVISSNSAVLNTLARP